MKPYLQLQQNQQLVLTPQLQQAIRLLQLSTLDLKQEIQQTLETNPMLEIIDSSDNMDALNPASTSADEQEILERQEPTELIVEPGWEHLPAYLNTEEEETPSFESLYANPENLQQHLRWQMNLSNFSEIETAIATSIIDAIDEAGFLTCTLNEIVDNFASYNAQQSISLNQVRDVLFQIQRFDPVGVGAQNLKECLLIQLSQLPLTTPGVSVAIDIIQNHLERLGHHQYKQLLRITQLTENELALALKHIQSLNPKPGNLITPPHTEYVIPDIIVSKRKNRWIAELNPEAIPQLRINGQYSALVKRSNNSADNLFLKNHLQEARWFLKSLQSRQQTLLSVANEIVAYQQNFFDKGEASMRPMILKDIADNIGMHESTISRITNQKYLYTPRGTFELKYFFSSHVDTSLGYEASSVAIRALIKQIITEENHKHPLSDRKIAKILNKKGINIARRTVAKYREAIGMPTSQERKCWGSSS